MTRTAWLLVSATYNRPAARLNPAGSSNRGGSSLAPDCKAPANVRQVFWAGSNDFDFVVVGVGDVQPAVAQGDPQRMLQTDFGSLPIDVAKREQPAAGQLRGADHGRHALALVEGHGADRLPRCRPRTARPRRRSARLGWQGGRSVGPVDDVLAAAAGEDSISPCGNFSRQNLVRAGHGDVQLPGVNPQHQGLLSAVLRGLRAGTSPGSNRCCDCLPVPAIVVTSCFFRSTRADQMVFGIGDVQHLAVHGHPLRMIEQTPWHSFHQGCRPRPSRSCRSAFPSSLATTMRLCRLSATNSRSWGASASTLPGKRSGVSAVRSASRLIGSVFRRARPVCGRRESFS